MIACLTPLPANRAVTGDRVSCSWISPARIDDSLAKYGLSGIERTLTK